MTLPPHTITLHFEGRTHQQLHELLMAFGFCFEINSSNKVGLLYKHESKPIEVQLAIIDDEYMAVTSDLTKTLGERINTEDSYTMLEWEWFDTAEDEIEFLRRELHVLVHVRPKSLAQIPA